MSQDEPKVMITEFEMTYPLLNLNLYTYNRKLYDALMIAHRVKEFNKGYYAKKVYKAARKGTRIKYSSFDCQEAADHERELLSMLQDEYNNNKENESEES